MGMGSLAMLAVLVGEAEAQAHAEEEAAAAVVVWVMVSKSHNAVLFHPSQSYRHQGRMFAMSAREHDEARSVTLLPEKERRS